MNNFFKSYFYFNRSEKNGILLFIPVILILFIIPAYRIYNRKPVQVDFSQYSKEIKAFESALQIDSIKNSRKKFVPDFERVDRSIAESRLHPFAFDPNGLPAEKWIAMGLSEKQVKTILNYQMKGGKFYHKEDLKKIYGISENEYAVLEPFIAISKPAYANETTPKKAWNSKFPEYKKTIIDINTADSVDLLEIRGIGPSFAHRILRYRDKLGGFYAKEQLLEVFGMDSVRYAQMFDYCTLGNSAVQKINLNTAVVADLKKHPYFDYYLAKSIVDYRIIHGPYTKVEQLRYTPLVYEELYKKIAPYLKTE
jgi:DNA uptake protein ComE-like DNA-binding protein